MNTEEREAECSNHLPEVTSSSEVGQDLTDDRQALAFWRDEASTLRDETITLRAKAREERRKRKRLERRSEAQFRYYKRRIVKLERMIEEERELEFPYSREWAEEFDSEDLVSTEDDEGRPARLTRGNNWEDSD